MGWMIRLIRLVACLFIVLSLNFALRRIIPGDPLLMLLGPEAVSLSEKTYEALRIEHGLNRSFGEQYLDYWVRLATGHFGYSFHHHRSVSSLIGDHLGRTLGLLVPAVLLSTLAAALLGTVAGWMRESPLDWTTTSLALFAYAMPAFLTAMVLLDLFSFRLRWFPLGGFSPPPEDNVSGWEAIAGQLRHLALPVVVLTLTSAAAKYLVMRNAVSKARDEAYVLYARAKGVAPCPGGCSSHTSSRTRASPSCTWLRSIWASWFPGPYWWKWSFPSTGWAASSTRPLCTGITRFCTVRSLCSRWW
jgi:peptide/nickel transport system permease protein